MKSDLEINDILCYIPYNLNIMYLEKIKYCIGYRHNILFLEHDTDHTFMEYEAPIKHCKPLLRNMYDLTKPMVHSDINDGKEFIPINLLVDTPSKYFYYKKLHIDKITKNKIVCWYEESDSSTSIIDIYLYPDKIELLNKLCFDYKNLIQQNLAIDINKKIKINEIT